MNTTSTSGIMGDLTRRSRRHNFLLVFIPPSGFPESNETFLLERGKGLCFFFETHLRMVIPESVSSSQLVLCQARIFLQRKELHELALKDQPVQAQSVGRV